MGVDFFDAEYKAVLVRIQRGTVAPEFIMSLLGTDLSFALPETAEMAGQVLNTDLRRHNFRAWALTLLSKLGFHCTNPLPGHYSVGSPSGNSTLPVFLEEQYKEYKPCILLFQRLLLGLALAGFGQHSRELFNHMAQLHYQRRVVGLQNSDFPPFFTWCAQNLWRPLFAAQPTPLSSDAGLDLTIQPDSQATGPFDFTSNNIPRRMMHCKHGICGVLTRFNGVPSICCRAGSELNCQFVHPCDPPVQS